MSLAILKTIPPWAMLGMGGLIGWARSLWGSLYNHTLGHLTKKVKVSLVVDKNEHSDAYQWLLLWLENQLSERQLTEVLLRRAGKQTSQGESEVSGSSPASEVEDTSSYILVPDFNTYRIRWRKRYLLVAQHLKDGKNSGAQNSGSQEGHRYGYPEITLRITIWGTRDRSMLLRLVEQAKAEFRDKYPEQLEYFTHRYGQWDSHTFQRRDMETIYMDNSIVEDIENDIRAFQGAEHSYRALGIPYRRGYGFWGPPGTGKTSLVRAIATEFNLPLYYLNLNDKDLSSDTLMRLLERVLTPSILLIEDVDCLSAACDREASGEVVINKPQLSTGDILNALDGIVATEGRILIMTSNHPERLDEALVRAGRLDRKWDIPYPNATHLRRFHGLASKHFTLPSWEDFRKQLPENATLADAQALAFKGGNVLAVGGTIDKEGTP